MNPWGQEPMGSSLDIIPFTAYFSPIKGIISRLDPFFFFAPFLLFFDWVIGGLPLEPVRTFTHSTDPADYAIWPCKKFPACGKNHRLCEQDPVY